MVEWIEKQLLKKQMDGRMDRTKQKDGWMDRKKRIAGWIPQTYPFIIHNYYI